MSAVPSEEQLHVYETSPERTAQVPTAAQHIAKIEVRTVETVYPATSANPKLET